MTTLDQLGVLLTNLPIYLANGVLVILYWLAAHSAALVSLACALSIMLLPDAQVQARASYRPSRHGESASNGPALRTAQITTAIVLTAWLMAQWDMAAPVPWIGAVMWVAGLVAVLALSSQRFNLLWYVKAGIAMYALAVIGSRIYLGYTSHLTVEQWAALVGSSESAATLIASTRGNVTTILLWALWLVVPLGYFSMLMQQVFINPMSIVNPLASAQEMLRALRMRVSR
jgi:hypothetical protein